MYSTTLVKVEGKPDKRSSRFSQVEEIVTKQSYWPSFHESLKATLIAWMAY